LYGELIIARERESLFESSITNHSHRHLSRFCKSITIIIFAITMWLIVVPNLDYRCANLRRAKIYLFVFVSLK